MTLVSEQYFRFGFKLTEKVSLALTQEKMDNDIEATIKGNKKKI